MFTGSYTVTPDPVVERKDKGVREFFETLGYVVSWDFNRNSGQRWFELHNNGLVAQIDMGVPLEFIIEDMVAWHLGQTPIDRPDKPDWICSGPNGPEQKELFKRVYDFHINRTLPCGQIEFELK